MNLFRRRTWPKQPFVHVSAFQRDAEYRKLIPADAICVGSAEDERESRSA